MRNSLEAFHKFVKPSQWWFFNRYMVPFIAYTVHFIGIFQMNPWVLHCDFSLYTQCISLRFFIIYPGYLIAIFQMDSWVFHCDFSLNTQCISLQFYKCIPGYFSFSLHGLCISLWIFIRYPVHFIAVFQLYPWVFYCDFSLDTQQISLWFFIT